MIDPDDKPGRYAHDLLRIFAGALIFVLATTVTLTIAAALLKVAWMFTHWAWSW